LRGGGEGGGEGVWREGMQVTVGEMLMCRLEELAHTELSDHQSTTTAVVPKAASKGR
jgi:hypothetical protein